MRSEFHDPASQSLRAYRSLRRRLRDPDVVNGQLTDFEVTAGVCAAALLGATLFEYVVRLSRKTLAHGRAAVWERRDREASTVGPYLASCAPDWSTTGPYQSQASSASSMSSRRP
jgi:hypothetical protein